MRPFRRRRHWNPSKARHPNHGEPGFAARTVVAAIGGNAHLAAARRHADVAETLQSLGCHMLPDTEIEDWMALVDAERGPMLIRAGCAARDWMNRPGVTDRDLGGLFLAACILSGGKSRRPLALPFWSAAEARINGASCDWRTLAGRIPRMRRRGSKNRLDELERLRGAEEISRSLGRTARSRLPDTANADLRASIVTARDLAATLAVSPQAALGLLRQLTEEGAPRSFVP